jgi:hypothetical protein
MDATGALNCLGVNRVIWVDDLFNKSPPDLAEMLLNASDTALECDFQDIASILQKATFGAEGLDENLKEELSDKLTELGEARSREIREKFFAHEAVKQIFATAEMTDPAVVKVCVLLQIVEDDRWTFDRATAEIPELCKNGDGEIAYIVDLNETGGSATRGLQILELLHAKKSKGTAFILTHEADRNGEAAKENALRQLLTDTQKNPFEVPICVISKQRLITPEKETDVEEDLKVAMKRAGLRKSLSSVVSHAKAIVADAFEAAAKGLLSIPPEQLEQYVFDRSYKEGVSELHVVERILTSQIAQSLRGFFGTNDVVLADAYRLRELRGITLGEPVREVDPQLADFRLAEVWEGSDLVNRALAPIACGDVFETDDFEGVPGKPKLFMLLGQPCDIALRPEEKSRARDTGFLVPLVRLDDPAKASEDDFVLPCKMYNHYWECDFRNTSTIRLDILDLASFRMDGRVRVDHEHVPPKDLVPSQKRIYEKRTANATKAMADGSYFGSDQRSIHPSLQLAFSWGDSFKQYYCASLSDAKKENRQGNKPALPKRVTWRLKRMGRVRMPYAAALLDGYLAGISRHAFDMDYISPGRKPIEKPSGAGARPSGSDAGEGVAVSEEHVPVAKE